MKILEKTITSVSELLSEVGALQPPRQPTHENDPNAPTYQFHPAKDWIFRGVEDANFDLIPSIGRPSDTSRSKLTKTVEQNLLGRFKDQVRAFVRLDIDNTLEWLILAQHHGLPTRLLDWTRSPIVAAYFAVRTVQKQISFDESGLKTERDINGAVYCAPRPNAVTARNRSDPFSIDRILFVDPPHISERVTRQSGVFTIHPTPENAWSPEGAVRFTIPMHAKMEMKFELDRLGLNEATLFPGIDAIARYLGWQFKWGI